MGATGVQDQFGSAAQVSSALLRVAPGTDERALLSSLQAKLISSSLVATAMQILPALAVRVDN